MKFLHTKKKIYNELIDLGLKRGMYVNLKCSYSSLGNIEGGPMSLIDVILDIIKENGLLVIDSFVRMYKVGSRDIMNNKVDQNSKSYAGLIANIALKHKDCFRSHHPIQKFSLIGEEANNLAIQHNKNSYAFDILKIMSKEKNSFNLKIGPDDKVIGVGTTHVATGILNIEKYEQKVGVYYEDTENKYELFKRNWIGLCKNTLLQLNGFYNKNVNINKYRGKVGSTHALLTNMSETLNEELKLFRSSKDDISCKKKYCFECYTLKNNYREHANFFIKNLINFNIKNTAKFLYYDLSLQPTFKIK